MIPNRERYIPTDQNLRAQTSSKQPKMAEPFSDAGGFFVTQLAKVMPAMVLPICYSQPRDCAENFGRKPENQTRPDPWN